MATTTISVSVQNTNLGTTINGAANVTLTPVGNNFSSFVQTTSTAAAAINVAGTGLTTYGGPFMLKNNSVTVGEDINIYQDGATCSVLIGKLIVGAAPFTFSPSAALGCKAVTGTPDLQVIALEP